MYYGLNEYKSVVTRLGVALLFFTLFFNVLYGGVSELANILIKAFPKSDGVYITCDLMCSLSYLLSFVLPVPLYYAISKKSICHPMELTLKLPGDRPARVYAAVVFAGLGLIIPMAMLNSLLFPVTTPDGYGVASGVGFSKSYILVLDFIASAIVPAFAEEFLFRGLLVSNLKPYNKGAAVVVSAVAFGMMHQNPRQILYATAAGLLFGFIYVFTDSIWCCIAVHFINNFISVIQVYLQQVIELEILYMFVAFFDLFVIIIGVICGLYLLHGVGADIKKNSEPKGGLFGNYKTVKIIGDAKINYTVKAFTTPTFAVFIGICAVITFVTAIIYKAVA